MNPASVRFAVVRPVPDTFDRCVRTNVERIDVELARVQHREYCEALQRLGLNLIWVEGDNTLPDSCFVEDTAVIFGQKAVICNMSLESRAREAVGVANVLEKLKQTRYIRKPGLIDGGDVLKVEDKVFVGLSARTNSEALEQVERILKDTSFNVVPVKVRNVLHLKSACTYLGNDYVILSEGNFDTDVLAGLRKIVVPKGEEYAADCLTINGTVLMAKGYPKTKRFIENEGFTVEELKVSEFRKGDGALTCLSIIW